ncbi:MAG: hypothetical protein J6Q60_05735 [Bacteroidaceae bacterium]|nr:hypothetical protein [Bacteroidaceae bacterium]
MKLTDLLIARFDNEIRIFAKKFGLTAETEHTLLHKRTDVRLSSGVKYKRYVLEWDDVPNFTTAMNHIVRDASMFFGANRVNNTNCYVSPFGISNVIFNNPATIVLWDDGTKTVVKCQEGDEYSEEVGLALCFAKKALGNKPNFNNVFKKWIPEETTNAIDDSELRKSMATAGAASSIASDVMAKFHEAMQQKRKADEFLRGV